MTDFAVHEIQTGLAPARLSAGLALWLLAVPLAQAATELDRDGDGQLSFEEVQRLYPDIDARTFLAMDLDADGALDDDEVVAARQAGLMPEIAE